ncbi:MAG: flagellar biosynthesis protein FlhF [Pseudomonadota bacterium]
MNVKRFTARTAREALAQVREALGEDAVVLSTKPSADGVEVLALAPEGMARIAQAAAQAPAPRQQPLPVLQAAVPMPAPSAPAGAAPRAMSLSERIAARGERLDARSAERIEPGLFSDGAPDPGLDGAVARDVETLGMSTLTFQDYVRERMLKRRQAELAQQPATLQQRLAPQQPATSAAAPVAPAEPAASAPLRVVPRSERRTEAAVPERHAALRERIHTAAGPRREPPVLRDEIRLAGPGRHDLLGAAGAQQGTNPLADVARGASEDALGGLRDELQSVRALIDERFGMLAFMERLQRDPRQATLSQSLFDAGLSPALVRKLVQGLPAGASDPLAWATGVLERNVHTDEADAPLEDHDGVLALIGPTGVGKTTSTAKLAAAFAARHGAANLGLITLDAYRVAAHEQLRAYGRILGVPVHTAHDRASLEDLLELLSGKKLVLIDTAGMAQRDARTRELLEMLQHPAISKLLVINAAAQGETVEDVMVAYGVQQCLGVIVSKLDEAVKLGPALDALIRHRARVVGVANGQRVPEDWHRLSAQALVQRALRGGGNAAWKLDAAEVNLVFAAIHGAGYPAATAAGQGAPLPA